MKCATSVLNMPPPPGRSAWGSKVQISSFLVVRVSGAIGQAISPFRRGYKDLGPAQEGQGQKIGKDLRDMAIFCQSCALSSLASQECGRPVSNKGAYVLGQRL